MKEIAAVTMALIAAASASAADAPDKWVPMFNGRDLSGWTPKFTGSPAGENVLRTFRVEDGVLAVSYDGYDELRGRFGHLFYERLCSPGTHVVIGETLVTEHCPQTSTVAVPPGAWTRFEVEVRGDRLVRHLVNGTVAAEYGQPQYDPQDQDGKRVMGSGPLALREGYVALQAESHPVQFRNVELLVLEP